VQTSSCAYLHVYLNNGDGTFTEVTGTSESPAWSRGGTAAAALEQGTARIDFFAGDSAPWGASSVRNSNGNHWLRVELAGRSSDLNGTGPW